MSGEIRNSFRVKIVAKLDAFFSFRYAPRVNSRNASTWTFLTNHAHVLLCLARSPSMLMRNIAAEVGITERAVQRIIAELRDEGYVTMEREGRRNSYRIAVERRLKHPIEARRRLADLIELALEGTPKPSRGGAARHG